MRCWSRARLGARPTIDRGDRRSDFANESPAFGRCRPRDSPRRPRASAPGIPASPRIVVSSPGARSCVRSSRPRRSPRPALAFKAADFKTCATSSDARAIATPPTAPPPPSTPSPTPSPSRATDRRPRRRSSRTATPPARSPSPSPPSATRAWSARAWTTRNTPGTASPTSSSTTSIVDDPSSPPRPPSSPRTIPAPPRHHLLRPHPARAARGAPRPIPRRAPPRRRRDHRLQRPRTVRVRTTGRRGGGGVRVGDGAARTPSPPRPRRRRFATFATNDDTRPNGPTAVAFDVAFLAPDTCTAYPNARRACRFVPLSKAARTVMRVRHPLGALPHVQPRRLRVRTRFPVRTLRVHVMLAPHGDEHSSVTSGVYYHNPTETYVDVLRRADRARTRWMSESGAVDFSSSRGPRPRRRRDSTRR